MADDLEIGRVARASGLNPSRAGESDVPRGCFHGGAFFEAVGTDFRDLGRRQRMINADVLDAWFDPAPGVVSALQAHLTWLLRTSPPIDAEGLIAEIAAARGLPEESLVPGAGSSDLIFRALPRWLSPASRTLILEPTYGEYAHVLESVIGCRVDRLALRRGDGFEVPLEGLTAALRRGYDLVALVNPNNPTGRHLPRRSLEPILAHLPARTRVWIDEAYVDYAGPGESLEAIACRSRNVVVCKSMSKVYALSGARVAYLCCEPRLARDLRSVTPPWVVSLPAQVAAVHALRDPAYYAARYRQTSCLRDELAAILRRAARVEVLAGVLNAVLCLLPEDGPDASAVAAVCRERGLFVRDCGVTCPSLGRHALRISVKDAATNRRTVEIFAASLVDAGLGRTNRFD
jgi:histidinol-phosphate/aromatic aminotransferase/cobyric acid decarboxylase-like protein